MEEVVPSVAPPLIPIPRKSSRGGLKKKRSSSKSMMNMVGEFGDDGGYDDDDDDEVLATMLENPGNVNVMSVLARNQCQSHQPMPHQPLKTTHPAVGSTPDPATIRSGPSAATTRKHRASMLDNVSKSNALTNPSFSSSSSRRGMVCSNRDLLSSDGSAHGNDPGESHTSQKGKLKGAVKGLMATVRLSAKKH